MELPIELQDLWNEIMDDNNIKTFSDQDDLINVICEINYESSVAVKNFLELLISLMDLLINITNEKSLLMFRDIILKTITEHPKKVMEKYIMKAYNIDDNALIRKKIVELNEDFFLENSFGDDEDDPNNIINRIFNFKKVWPQLLEENRNIIKFIYLKNLCICSDIRYKCIHKYHEIRKLNGKYEHLFDDDF